MTAITERQQRAYIGAVAAEARVNVELETEGMTLNIGPQHPATHGTLRIVVKLDGAGQMPAPLIPYLIAPIAAGHADYVKGNHFYNVRHARDMSTTRTPSSGQAASAAVRARSSSLYFV